MSRFYVAKESIKGNSVHISGKEAHHILDVMRLKVLDRVTVFDGSGAEYSAVIREARPKSLSLEIIETRKNPQKENYTITLVQAIPKKDKMDYIVEKATELGVRRMIPVITARTIPDWSEGKKAKALERWRRISLEAAKQCGRADIPEIMPIVNFTGAVGAVENNDNTAPVYDLKLIAALSDKAVRLKDALRGSSGGRILIAIGPEGDFTPEELNEASAAGFKVVDLGARVLKSDTAGLAVLAMINYEYSN